MAGTRSGIPDRAAASVQILAILDPQDGAISLDACQIKLLQRAGPSLVIH